MNELDNLDLNLNEQDFGDLEISETQTNTHSEPTATPSNPAIFNSIPVNVSIEVSSKKVSIRDFLNYEQGSTIQLDKLIGEPVDLKVNGVLFAKGQVLESNGHYAVKLLSLTEKVN